MKLALSVYPQDINDPYLAQYLDNARKLNYQEVFSSIHLAEYDVAIQIEQLYELSKLIKSYDMTLCVDIGGAMIKRLITDKTLSDKLKACEISALRLDYDYDHQAILILSEMLDLKRFIINASLLDRDKISALLALSDKIKWEAWHNFYPRPLTGISYDFYYQQSLLFKEKGIAVGAFICAFNKPRGPLHAGLVTIERHRDISIAEAAYELMASKVCDKLIIADPLASQFELESLASINSNEPFVLNIKCANDISDAERELLFNGLHQVRYDNSEYALRLITSRNMAEQGKMIDPRLSKARKVGDVTIDNSGYKRYSGEVQLIIKDCPLDERVNIAASIAKEDLWLLKYLTNERYFYFKEKE